MASNYDAHPEIEDLVGAGMPFAEGAAFLDFIKTNKWEPKRTWSYLQMRDSKSFPKLNAEDLARHLKQVFGDVSASEMR